ncbi:MAG: hydantoinase B/oxoprolinase family protein [Mycolicibacterium hassiacum]|uniref:hydantoinase B/oxoprolinase family protein n=1 Tax=Mycolicibacterium hassiacum TaxID=46351 RepID=UPI0023FA2973|nr:hydantoinase B/oxoprolinase family protein [Mycolicibacterium hassiacum]MBX5485429.1 hydantoinase B/oxoprolinase family protein [Mycolicibacterium hassiacum]
MIDARTTRLDPILFAVVRNALASAAREMYSTFKRTAMLPILYEYNDFGMSLYDHRLNLLADAPGLPIFLGSLDVCIARSLEEIGGRDALRPGDVILNNHPFLTGGQPPDVALMKPIFHGDELVGFAALRAHMGDLGAKNAYPVDSTELYQEGTLFPAVKLYDEGRLNEAILRIIGANSRLPTETVGNVMAAAGALTPCENKVVGIVEKYSLEAYHAVVDELIEQGERAVRAAIAEIPDGVYVCEDEMDDNGVTPGSVPLAVKVTVRGSDVEIDLSGSAGTQVGPINCPWPYTLTSCRFALKCITTPDLPPNGGEWRPLTVIAPEGNIFNPVPPAPTFLGGGTSLRLVDMIVRALAPALPERIPADNAGDLVMTIAYVEDPTTRRLNFFFDAGALGHGATRDRDGMNGLIHPIEAGCESLPTEVLEARMPVRKHRFGFVTDSGGPGRRRGGLAAEAEFEFLSDGNAVVWAEKSAASTVLGLDGGGSPPERNQIVVYPGTEREQRLGKRADLSLRPGDRIVVRPAGGGGYGDPLDREPELVAADVKNEYVSREQAESVYGVVLDDAGAVDARATAELRRARRA